MPGRRSRAGLLPLCSPEGSIGYYQRVALSDSHHGSVPLDLDWLGHGLSCLLLKLLLAKGLKHLLASSLVIEALALEPRVASDLLEGHALFRVVGEETKDEVLEVLAESSAVNLLEVGVDLTFAEEVVEVLFLAGLLEWENALDNDEEDDSDGEHVDLLALVLLALLNFGSHVSHGATVGVKSINVLVAGEAEVGNLEVQVVIDKDVLKLEVAVNHASGVHEVDRLKHLMEEEAASIFTHRAHSLAKVEEEATLDEFHHDEDKVFNDAARRLHNLTSIAIFVHVDDALMLEVLKNSDLVVDRKNRVLVAAEELLLEDLDRDVLFLVN